MVPNSKVTELFTAKNTVISPDFLVCKFCGKAQFPHIFGGFASKTIRKFVFPKNFHTRKSGEITVFFAELLLVHLLDMNSFIRFEDHLHFEQIHKLRGVTYQFSYAMRHNDSPEWGSGAEG